MITFSHNCPYCGVENTAFEVVNYSQREYDDLPMDVYAILATCNHCGKGIVANLGIDNRPRYTEWGRTIPSESKDALYKLKNHQGEKYRLEEILGFMPEFEPKPAEPEIPAHLPQLINDKIRGAEKLYLKAQGDPDMIDYAGTAYRKTLEIALAQLDDSSDKNINWRVNSLVKRGVLVKSMGDFAHSIRVLGNEATHSDFSLDELEELRLFTQLFLQYIFTLPAKIPDKVKHSEQV
ncbi:DUF4145 domain-containing protein [Avibacterium paragallinarum]|uniref:DUF4145 domain-containing protein n=1 Tax=Avibacterium paragallinarum TaxID=728 RepID=UPI00397D982A